MSRNYFFSKKKPEVGDRGFIVGNRFIPINSKGKILLDIKCNTFPLIDDSIYKRNISTLGSGLSLSDESLYRDRSYGGIVIVEDSKDFVTGYRNFECSISFLKKSSTVSWSRLIETGSYQKSNCWLFGFDENAQKIGIQLGKDGGGGDRIDCDNNLSNDVWYKLTFIRKNNIGYMKINDELQSETLNLSEQVFNSLEFRLFGSKLQDGTWEQTPGSRFGMTGYVKDIIFKLY